MKKRNCATLLVFLLALAFTRFLTPLPARNPQALVTFEGVRLPGKTPAESFYLHYSNNPIISGENIYAPSLVDADGKWHLFYGGWSTFDRFGKDDIYLATTSDSSLRGAYREHDIIIRQGIYIHANDPSVVRLRDDLWIMALTVFRQERVDHVAIATSPDGYTWSPQEFTGRSHEVTITNAEMAMMARPSLIFNDQQSRWELYFDGREAGEDAVQGQFLAISEQEVPREFELVGFLGPWVDADIKRLPDGRYIAAYRRIGDTPPWPLHYAESSDGLHFEEHGAFLRPDPLNPYDDHIVSNPGWAVDAKGIPRAILFGGSARGINQHDLGIAYPQLAVQGYDGETAFNHRQADGPDSQRLYLLPGRSIDRFVAWTTMARPITEQRFSDKVGNGDRVVIELPDTPPPELDASQFRSPLEETQPAANFRPPQPEPMPMKADASSEAFAELGPRKAIDGDRTTFWSSSAWESSVGREWLAIDLLEKRTIRGVILQPRAGGYGFPVDFFFEYSLDGEEWHQPDALDFSDYPNPGSKPQRLGLEEPMELRHLRLVATRTSEDNFGSRYMQIAEIKVEVAE